MNPATPVMRNLAISVNYQFENPQDHHRLRENSKRFARSSWSAFRVFDRVGSYPSSSNDITALYATGFTVVEWMLSRRDRTTLLRFMLDERLPSTKFADYYGMSPSLAEANWLSWQASRSSTCEDCSCLTHAKFEYVAKPAVEGKPTMWVVSDNWCLPCLAFHNDVLFDSQFKRRLEDRFNVVAINYSKNKAWATSKGVSSIPAFVIDGGSSVLGYRGKHALIAELDSCLSRLEMPIASDTAAPPPPEEEAPKPITEGPGLEDALVDIRKYVRDSIGNLVWKE